MNNSLRQSLQVGAQTNSDSAWNLCYISISLKYYFKFHFLLGFKRSITLFLAVSLTNLEWKHWRLPFFLLQHPAAVLWSSLIKWLLLQNRLGFVDRRPQLYQQDEGHCESLQAAQRQGVFHTLPACLPALATTVRWLWWWPIKSWSHSKHLATVTLIVVVCAKKKYKF